MGYYIYNDIRDQIVLDTSNLKGIDLLSTKVLLICEMYKKGTNINSTKIVIKRVSDIRCIPIYMTEISCDSDETEYCKFSVMKEAKLNITLD